MKLFDMAKFCLNDSEEHYLALSEQPKRFDADSPVTNVFFDDTNGQVFTVRSGGVTGVTVTGMDEKKCTSFRMEDRGPIISIKFSPDHKTLAIQRNAENQNANVEFANFKDLTPSNVEYSHTCKWKNAKILGFVWPKANEIAYITDHGIELLSVLPEKKVLKSIKTTSFSGAWFTWCSQSNIVLLAGNNGALLQPFLLKNSTINKLQKLELEQARPVVERDVLILRLCHMTWCAVFRHGTLPTELWLMPIGGSGTENTHILKTGLVGRFAVSVVDDLVAVHHQSSQTSVLFDIMEASKPENNIVVHLPIVAGKTIKPAIVDDQPCPMYSGNWVVFQPNYVIDARRGCLWQVDFVPAGLAHSVPKEEISNVVAVLLRRSLTHVEAKETVYRILRQLVTNAGTYLVELTKVFDEINAVYKKWADGEVARNTAGHTGAAGPAVGASGARGGRVLISQDDVCAHVLRPHADDTYIVQVMTAYIASVCRHGMVVQHCCAERLVACAAARGALWRLRALVRRGALHDSRPLACTLLSLGHLDPQAAQLALDMMARLNTHEDIVEVLLSWNSPVSAAGAARQAEARDTRDSRDARDAWSALAPRKLLSAARQHSPGAFVALYHMLQARNERIRGDPSFLKSEQCDAYVEYYKQVTAEAD